MFSEKNSSLLEEENIQYIVGAKLRTMDKKTKEAILEESSYKANINAVRLSSKYLI